MKCKVKQYQKGWRSAMEDALIVELDITDEVLGVFAVFDGHGGFVIEKGAEVAKFCRKNFVNSLKSNDSFKKNDYRVALEDTFLKMDELILSEEGRKELVVYQKEKDDYIEENTTAGCTANVVLLTEKKIFVANAGDSRSVLSKGGKVVEMSIDHKPDLDSEYERIEKAGGTISHGRVDGNLNLSRAIGDFEYKEDAKLSPKEQKITAFPEVKVFEIDGKEEFIVIGCDGIWDGRSNSENIDEIRESLYEKKLGLEKTAENLLEKLLAKHHSGPYGNDNMSLIIVQFNK